MAIVGSEGRAADAALFVNFDWSARVMRTSRLPLALIVPLLAAMTVAAGAAKDPDGERIARLVIQLGSSRFVERQAASHALDAIGESALPALRMAARSDDAEVSRRAE